jgi:hypothetical protein
MQSMTGELSVGHVVCGSCVWRDLDGVLHAARVLNLDAEGLATIKYETGHMEEGVHRSELLLRESLADFPKMSMEAASIRAEQCRAKDDLGAPRKSLQHRMRRRVSFTCLQEVKAPVVFSLLPLAAPCCACSKVTLYRCKRCNSCFYCSKNCQQRDAQQHEALCDALASPFRPLFSYPQPLCPTATPPPSSPRSSSSSSSTSSSTCRRACVTPLSSPSRRHRGLQKQTQAQTQTPSLPSTEAAQAPPRAFAASLSLFADMD